MTYMTLKPVALALTVSGLELGIHLHILHGCRRGD